MYLLIMKRFWLKKKWKPKVEDWQKISFKSLALVVVLRQCFAGRIKLKKPKLEINIENFI